MNTQFKCIDIGRNTKAGNVREYLTPECHRIIIVFIDMEFRAAHSSSLAAYFRLNKANLLSLCFELRREWSIRTHFVDCQMGFYLSHLIGVFAWPFIECGTASIFGCSLLRPFSVSFSLLQKYTVIVYNAFASLCECYMRAHLCVSACVCVFGKTRQFLIRFSTQFMRKDIIYKTLNGFNLSC